MFGSPVDFSFKELNTISDVLSEEANTVARPAKRDSEQKYISHSLRLSNNFIIELRGLMETLTATFSNPARLAWLDLSFNQIQHIDSALTQLKELRLLYLHGNQICKLSEVDKLALLPSLHTITLHGNPMVTEKDYRAWTWQKDKTIKETFIFIHLADTCIQSDWFEVTHILTLRSPWGLHPWHLAHLIATIPHLKMIDFSAVTKQERELTAVWKKSRNPRKSPSHTKSN